MNIGFNLLLWTPEFHPDQDLGLLKALKGAGYDGVELPLFNPDATHYPAIGTALRDHGLRSTAVTVMPGEQASCVSPDAASRAAAVVHLKKVVDRCHEAGVELLMGPFHQPLGIFTGNGPTGDEKKWAAEVHHQIAEYGQSAGVKIVIEWLNRFECYFLTTMAQAADYVRQVNHPNFGTMFDTFHANIEEKDPVASLKAHLDVVKHFHVSENDRGTPGSGHAAIRETIAVMKEANYEGWLTVEAFGRSLPELAAATRVWRDFFPSKEDVYEGGIRYIRECWGA